MDSQTIREALGKLQADPDAEEQWAQLRTELESPDGDLPAEELAHLLAAARQEHAKRGEWDAVRRLLEVELATPGSGEQASLLAEYGRVLSVELLDDASASEAYAKLIDLGRASPEVEQALADIKDRHERHKDLIKGYIAEADTAPDDVYKSSMLMRASEMQLRFAAEGSDLAPVVERLEQAVRLDPSNVTASKILERVYRREQRWDEAARVLERVADRSEDQESRVAAGIRLARLYLVKLDDKGRASRAYDRVLRVVSNHPEAMSFLSEYYSTEERWDDLVALYENELKAKDQGSSDTIGDMFQIAMLHWKKRENSAAAEPWFEKILKLEAGHEGALNFFRAYCAELDDDARLFEILQAAQRDVRDKKKKAALAKEVAKLAEGQENAQKAIEQYKSVLRQDPDSQEARDGLKRLYKQTQGFNALVELLRQELERTPQEAHEARAAILREVATVYRQYIKSDTALVAVLNQIVQLDDKLDERDINEIRELVGLYERLGRWRDLLTNQQRLAEWTTDVEEKKTLYRAVARRWLDQFSNIQNATEAYAALLAIEPEDTEARERLEELYRKRRAWPALFELYEGELERAEGSARLSLMREMAALAAERLSRPADAIALYQRILKEEGPREDALLALERHAERAKDWPNLVEALEQRVSLTDDVAAQLALLQKLGSVCSEHLGDDERAAKAWRRVLELQPGHHRALRVLRDSLLQSRNYDGLEQLYASQQDFEGLAEVLSNAADRTKDEAEKVDLSYRAARVYEEELQKPDRAFRSYERVLAATPDDARAARALIPLYEEDEKWARLPALYEVLLAKTEDDEEKVDLLSRLVQIVGGKLSDKKAALEYARQAYVASPRSRKALELLEQTAEQSGSWHGFVEALEERLASMPPPPLEEPSSEPALEAATEPAGKRRRGGRNKRKKGAATSAPDHAEVPAAPAMPRGFTMEERRNLGLRLAEVYHRELGKTDDSVRALKRLLESNPKDTEAATTLEGILRAEDRRDDLRWLLELRVKAADDDEQRLTILRDWATLEEEVFESVTGAIALHRRSLELSPEDTETMVALARLLLAEGDAAGAAEVIEQHRDVESGETRTRLELDLASLYLERLGRPGDALRACTRALQDEGDRARLVSVLERLAQVDETKPRAAELLADLYSTAGDARRETQALELMLKESSDRSERLSLFQRLAAVLEHKLGSQSRALDVMLAALGEFPNELALWDRAELLSAESGRPTDLADRFREALHGKLERELEVELSERAARLHEDKLGDPMGAAPYLQRMLELDPSNEVAFQHLKDILTAAESWGELELLYDRASRATEDSARRVDMLVEVALICEEIIEDAKKATAYYERILELEPGHDGSLKALDRLYDRLGEREKLAELLTRRLELAAGDEILELKLRLARLEIDLHRPSYAIDHVEDVLAERLNDYDARELAERLLEIGDLKVRAARMLEAVYEARDEIRDLVRVLTIRLEALVANEDAPVDERCELLRRIALLRDDRLHDDEGSLDILCQLVPLDPLDADARARLLEVGVRAKAQERIAEVLVRSAERADTPGLKGEILSKVAKLYEESLQDVQRAEAVHRQVLVLDDDDVDLVLPAAQALERIYAESGRHAELAEMLKVQVRLEADREARANLLGRLGELYRQQLSDLDGAIRAYSLRLEDNPEDGVALKALDQLYEKAERWRELVSILERRRDRSDDNDERKSIMLRMAETEWHKLEALPNAIDSYQALVDEYGAEENSLKALEALFAATERWDELNDIIERHLDVTDSNDERLGLLARQGDIRLEHLGDWEGAIESYRRALTIDPAHARSREALQRLLAAEDSITRREAAGILGPIYEAENASEELLKVLEIQVDAADDPEARLLGLERARAVAEEGLSDASRAYNYAARAVREARGHTALRPYLEHLERLASSTGRQADQVKLLCEVIPDIFDGEVQLSVTLKVASLARHHLADADLAKEYYKKALELRVDDPEALLALESLYDEAGDAVNLLDILERRADVAETEDDRKQLLFRRGKLLSDVLEDRARAIQVYESIIDTVLDTVALDALETLYTAEEQWVELISLYQRQLDEGAGDKPSLHVKIADVAAKHQSDFDRAFDEFEAALNLDRQHGAAVAGLEALLDGGAEPEYRARAARLLEPVYQQRADYARMMSAIRARLDFSQDPTERRDLLGRLAQLYEEQAEDYVAALETTAQLLEEDLSDQETISELERLAKVAGAEKRLAEIYAIRLEELAGDDEASARLCHRTAELFASQNELERALEFYRRALEFEPESSVLFDSIDGILVKTEKHAERVALYREALEHRYEPAERLKALHVIAGLEKDQLQNPDGAIQTYRSALEVEEAHVPTLEALTSLYTKEKRWEDLAEHLLRRAELSESPNAAAVHRLALAQLYAGELQRPEQALDQLEEIVREIPSHTAAVEALERLKQDDAHRERVVEVLRPLYESLDDWRRLIKLNEDRFQLADDDLARSVVLRETAELWETRGQDQNKARQALLEALRLEPDDEDTRASYERLVEATDAWEELTQLYEEILDAGSELTSQRDYLAALAKVHNVRRDDPRRALQAYQRLHEVDPSDLDAVGRMERLATLLSDWPVLVKVLIAKVDLVLDDEERASIWRRIGEARRDMLEDSAGAIQAYERSLEVDEHSSFTLDCLIDLYESAADPERLVELYQKRVELCDEDDNELRFELLVSAAGVLEEKLKDRSRAIDTLKAALDVRVNDLAVLAHLDDLYEAEEQWQDLLDNLRAQEEVVEDAEQKAKLRAKMGSVLSDKLHNYDDAIDVYATMLSAAPSDTDVVRSVTRLGEEQEDMRLRVAEVLVPVLRETQQHESLVGILEMRLTAESDPVDRRVTLVQIAQVLEQQLSRQSAALAAYLRALGETPEDAELHESIERLCDATNEWGKYADVLEERALATFEPDLVRDLSVRTGRVAEEQLGDKARAIAAYERAVEQVGDQPELLAALDRLYTAQEQTEKLSEIINRRMMVEDDGDTQAELQYRLGRLHADSFNDLAQALGCFRGALERRQDHEEAVLALEKLTDERDLFEEAAEVLEEVFRARGQTARLAALYEKRIGFADSDEERAQMRRNLAQVLEQDCSDARAALQVLQQGLREAPSDPALLDEVERLAAQTGEWSGASTALAEALEKATSLDSATLVDLYQRLAEWQRDRLDDAAAAERSLEKALEQDPNRDELLASLEDLQTGEGREVDLIRTLRRRAKLALDDVGREEFYRRAKSLADAKGDASLGEELLRELVGLDEVNLWALAELTGVTEAKGAYQETFDLLVKRSELRATAEIVRELRHQAARLAEDKLARLEDSTGLYEMLFEDDPQDTTASEALRRLYASLKRYDDLARLLDRLLDLTDDVEERCKLLIELAQLHEEQLGSTHDAVEVLRLVLDEQPGHSEAVVSLSRLYEKEERDEDLAALLTSQISAAEERGDTDAVLSFQVRLGEIYEGRLGDNDKAVSAYRAVLERQQDHSGALEALARLYTSQQDHEALVPVLKQLLAQSSGNDAVERASALADAYLALKDQDGEVAALEQGLAHDEQSDGLRGRLEKLYEGQAAWAQLSRLWVKGADLLEDVNQKVALLRRAADLHAEKLADHAAAAELLTKASELKPDDRELLLSLCDAYSASGKGREAAEVLQMIVDSYGGKRSKELGEIHRRLADAYLVQGETEKALAELDKAFRIEPGNVSVLKKLGDVALEAGDMKKAQQMFRALLLQRLDAKSPITKAQVFMKLGMVHEKLGEKPKAIQMLERALQTDADLSEAKALLEQLKG